MPGDLGPGKALLAEVSGLERGIQSPTGRAGVWGDTGGFRGQVEARALASDDLLKLGRGHEQLRARSDKSLWNQPPPTHFWQIPGHGWTKQDFSNSSFCRESLGVEEVGTGAGSTAPPLCPLHVFLLLIPTAFGSCTSFMRTGRKRLGSHRLFPVPRPCLKTDNLKALSPCPEWRQL